MKLILSTHNVTLTDAIEKHVLAKLEKLDRLNSRVVHARVTLEHDHMRVPERQLAARVGRYLEPRLGSARVTPLAASTLKRSAWIGIPRRRMKPMILP